MSSNYENLKSKYSHAICLRDILLRNLSGNVRRLQSGASLEYYVKHDAITEEQAEELHNLRLEYTDKALEIITGRIKGFRTKIEAIEDLLADMEQ